MASTYENVPVFRDFRDWELENLIGRAQVEVREDGKTVITIEAFDKLTEFLKLGELKSLSLSAFITDVNNEKAAEYWASQRR